MAVDGFDEGSADIERLAFLDEALQGKRVVFLGEPNHWIHEKYPYRLFMIRYLFSRGWRYLGEELGWFDGARIDGFLETGDSAHLDQVTAYGYGGADRPDRNDEPTGILRDGWGSYPTQLFRAEQVRFAQALRHLSEQRPEGSERLHFFGFDVDYTPGAGYEHVRELMAEASGTSPVREIEALLAQVRGESIEDETARLGATLKAVEEHRGFLERMMGGDWYGQLHHAVLSLRDSFDYVRIAYPATGWATLRQAMAKREVVMHRHVTTVLSRIGPDDKVILMSHNLHLAKDDERISAPEVGAGPGGGSVPAVGTFLNRLLPDSVLSIWMLYDHERDCQPYPSLSSELTSIPSSLNAILAEVGSAFVLPTRSRDRRSRLMSVGTDIVSMFNQVFRAELATQADAVFFVRSVSPLRP